MQTDIVERLTEMVANVGRDWRSGEEFLRSGHQSVVDGIREAAEVIDTLRREVEQARAGADESLWRFWSAKAAELATDNDRLRNDLVGARAEVARCHARLEIDHAWKWPEGGKFERFEIPMEERAKWPDAIECRDATISMLEAEVKKLSKKHRRSLADKEG